MDPAKSSVSGEKGELLVSKAAARSPTSRAVPTPDRVLRGRELGRIKAEVNAPDPNDSLSIVAGSERFLRDRAARRSVTGKRVDRRSGVKHRNQTSLTTGTNCRRKPENLRNKATVSRSKDTNDSNQALGPEDRKSLSNKAAPHSSRSRRSQPLQSQRGPSARVTCSSPALVCKSEPDTETACEVEGDALEGIERSDEGEDGDVLPDEEPPFRDDPKDLNYKPVAKRELQKPRQHPPKKELEKAKEDGRDIKTERASDMAVKMENEVGEGSEPPRKRGRRRKDDKTPRLPKRRKKPPVQYVRCEMEGCGTVLAHPRYLQHHIKYQHLLKKKYVCPHPSCGRLFRLQKQLLRHAKHHTDQRDYICEYCARAFKSSHNLAVHRMIHTGEKPLQCEICGFTCRQKASLNWHMKKHDADATYQFSCSICGKKFEKKDSVVAHKAKSHPEVLIAEALAANAGTFITTPAPVLETLPGDVPPAMPHVSQNQGLIPLQQVMLTLSPKNQVDSPQPQLLQLAPHHVVQMGHQPETSTLLQFSATHPYLSTTHPQLIQLTAHPSITTASGPQASLLTLSSIAALSPSTVTSHQAVEWVRESGAGTQGGEEEMMWERVVVERENDVGAMVWEGEREQEKMDGGTVLWEKEGERHMLLGSSEGQVTHGDSHELI